MLAALKYRQNILDNFYLEDDIIIRRKKNDSRNGRFKKHDYVKSYTLRGDKGNDYRGIHVPGSISGTSISLPWILTVLREIDFEDNNVLDHIDGDISNNDRTNLRVITQQMNCRNRTMHSNNTSGYTGISWHKNSKQYQVRRTIKGKRVMKCHKTLDGAILILNEFKKFNKEEGYTDRHGESKRSTTIESMC